MSTLSKLLRLILVAVAFTEGVCPSLQLLTLCAPSARRRAWPLHGGCAPFTKAVFLLYPPGLDQPGSLAQASLSKVDGHRISSPGHGS